LAVLKPQCAQYTKFFKPKTYNDCRIPNTLYCTLFIGKSGHPAPQSRHNLRSGHVRTNRPLPPPSTSFSSFSRLDPSPPPPPQLSGTATKEKTQKVKAAVQLRATSGNKDDPVIKEYVCRLRSAIFQLRLFMGQITV
jgi:hypothetical protein